MPAPRETAISATMESPASVGRAASTAGEAGCPTQPAGQALAPVGVAEEAARKIPVLGLPPRSAAAVAALERREVTLFVPLPGEDPHTDPACCSRSSVGPAAVAAPEVPISAVRAGAAVAAPTVLPPLARRTSSDGFAASSGGRDCARGAPRCC